MELEQFTTVNETKGLSSTFQSSEEGRSVQRPKRCDKHGNKNEDNSPKNVNDVSFSVFNHPTPTWTRFGSRPIFKGNLYLSNPSIWGKILYKAIFKGSMYLSNSSNRSKIWHKTIFKGSMYLSNPSNRRKIWHKAILKWGIIYPTPPTGARFGIRPIFRGLCIYPITPPWARFDTAHFLKRSTVGSNLELPFS